MRNKKSEIDFRRFKSITNKIEKEKLIALYIKELPVSDISSLQVRIVEHHYKADDIFTPNQKHQKINVQINREIIEKYRKQIEKNGKTRKIEHKLVTQ